MSQYRTGSEDQVNPSWDADCEPEPINVQEMLLDACVLAERAFRSTPGSNLPLELAALDCLRTAIRKAREIDAIDQVRR